MPDAPAERAPAPSAPCGEATPPPRASCSPVGTWRTAGGARTSRRALRPSRGGDPLRPATRLRVGVSEGQAAGLTVGLAARWVVGQLRLINGHVHAK